jgi:hypothetical protein
MKDRPEIQLVFSFVSMTIDAAVSELKMLKKANEEILLTLTKEWETARTEAGRDKVLLKKVNIEQHLRDIDLIAMAVRNSRAV